MKAEHRHELKTNELAEWIANLPQWASDNLGMIILVFLVVVLLPAGAYTYWHRKNVKSIQSWPLYLLQRLGTVEPVLPISVAVSA